MKRIMVAIAVLTGVWGPGRALGQTAPPDSVPAWVLGSNYNAGIRGGVSDVSMKHRMSGSLIGRSGLNLTGSIESNRRQFRLQNRRNDSKNFVAGLTAPLQHGLVVSGNFSDSRFFDRVFTAQNTLQNFRNDRQSARGSATYLQALPNGFSINAKTDAGLVRSEQTFEKTRALDGSVGGGFRWSKAQKFTVSGRGFIKLLAEQSEPGSLDTLITDLGGDEDSLATSMKYWISQGTTISANYSRYTKTKDFMDLPRGVFLDQQFDGDLIRETETLVADVFKVAADMVPISPVTLKLTGEHTVNLSDFAIAKRRFQETTTDKLGANLTYRMPKDIQFTATLENAETLRDLGPQSLGSYTDKRKSLKLVAAVPFTQTFRLQLQTGTSIVQTFYLDFVVNPRDRDQLDQYANVRLSSSPFAKITSQIYLAFNRTQYVSIDGSLSQNNRVESTWDFRPEFTYKINPRVELKQTYGMNLELTEFDFAANDNFLDRNFTFNNLIKAQIMPALNTEVRYSVVLHDRGSYLVPLEGGERILDITQEDRRDEMRISFRYRMSQHLTAVGENGYSRRRDTLASSVGRSSTFTDGSLDLGLEGSYDWGQQRNLNFRIKKVKKFGRFNSPEQEDYWEMDSTLAYKF